MVLFVDFRRRKGVEIDRLELVGYGWFDEKVWCLWVIRENVAWYTLISIFTFRDLAVNQIWSAWDYSNTIYLTYF